MKELSDDLMQRILATKKELEFAKIVIGEKVPFELWQANKQIKEHFEELKKLNSGISAYDNIGYLRKKNQ